MPLRHPAVPYTAPFVYFLLCLAALPKLGLPLRAELALWLVSGFAVLFYFSRPILDFRCRAPLASAALGAAVFFVWIAPDHLAPGWREHWIFSNAIFGRPETSLPAAALGDPAVIALRVGRAVALVPIVEELFWRGWLLRWLEREDFLSVAPGSYSRRAFWICAALFALEHGPYWDVGFLAGIAYNAWMVRTKNLADLMLAHAVTNGCLAAYVLWSGRFEYWL
jgi:CAAX prenyl protease-like protein